MRRIDCERYSECLTEVVKADLDGLDCAGCQCYRQERSSDYGDGTRYQLFLWALFKPQFYRRYRQLEKFSG